MSDTNQPDLEKQAAQFNRECAEQEARIEGERLTLEFGTRSTRRLDAGARPIEESPLFGGEAQGGLFE